MKRIRQKNDNRYFSSLFFYVSLLLVAAILAVSFVLELNFERIEQDNIYSFSEETLNQIGYTADSMLENAKLAVSQILLDSDIPRVFYASDMDPVELKTIVDRINLIGSMPFLQSVYLYNGRTDMYYTNTYGLQNSAGFADQDMVGIIEGFTPEMNLKPIARMIEKEISSDTVDYMVYSYIYYEPLGEGKGNAIILNISDIWLRKVMDALDQERRGTVIVVNDKGVVVSSAIKDELLRDESQELHIGRILHSPDRSGYFIEHVNGVKSLVTYVTSDTLGWKFVRTIPYRDAVRDLNQLRVLTVEICSMLLLAGLVATYIASRRLHRPVLDMLHRLDNQHRVIRDNSQKARQEFLRELIRKDVVWSPGAIAGKCTEFGFALGSYSSIRAVVLRIDRYSEFSEQYNAKDRRLLRFALLNIAGEILSSRIRSEGVDAGEDHVVLLVEEAGDDPGQTGSALSACSLAEIQDQLRSHLRLSVTVAVSRKGSSTADIPALYEEAIEASQYRIFTGWQSIISASELTETSSRSYRYPLQREEALTDALMLGRMEEVKAQCRSILESTKGYSYKDLNQTVFRLFFAVQMAVDTLQKASGYDYGINFKDVYAEISMMERLEDLEARFDKLFEQIGNGLEEKKSAKYDDLIHRIMDIIHNHYMRPDLGLNTIADSLGISPEYLGRLVKKHTFKSITDFINEVRIDRAVELLEGTNKLIAEISEQCGFSSTSYFGKVFKKMKGVTPNEYRQKAKN